MSWYVKPVPLNVIILYALTVSAIAPVHCSTVLFSRSRATASQRSCASIMLCLSLSTGGQPLTECRLPRVGLPSSGQGHRKRLVSLLAALSARALCEHIPGARASLGDINTHCSLQYCSVSL